MSLEFLHMCSWREFIALYGSWWTFSIISSTKEDSICWRESKLRTIIVNQLSRIFSSIKFNLLKYSLTCCTYHTESIDSILRTNSYGRIRYSFYSCLFGTGRIHYPFTAVLHSNSVSNDDSIYSTSDNYIVFLTPCQTLYLSWMARESHSLRILSCEKFKDMQLISWCCCEVLTSVWKFYVWAVFEWVNVFEVTKWLTIFL